VGNRGIFFGLYFSLHYLDYLTYNPVSLSMLFFGLIGLIGLLRGTYTLSFIFSIFNVFFFACVSLTFFKYDSHSVAGVNYFIEMLGAVWLTFRIQNDQAKKNRYSQFRG